jgi:hypothetical protein
MGSKGADLLDGWYLLEIFEYIPLFLPVKTYKYNSISYNENVK